MKSGSANARESAMRNWFKKLIALLVRKERTGAAQRTNWRGRLVDEITGEANSPVRLLEGDTYATLRPPSFAEETCHIEMPSNAAATLAVRQRVAEHLRANGFRAEDIGGVEVALEEALLNAIRHGNRNDSARKVRVTYATANDSLYILVGDEGEGFDPSAVPDPAGPENRERPGGRGLLLIWHYMSGAIVLGKGNYLLMWKRRNGHCHMARTPPQDEMAKPGEPAK
jgi:serine/threonine-protein kinase RsbW